METVTEITALTAPTSTGEVRKMFDRIAPTYDKVNKVLSLGINRWWEWRLVRNLLRTKGGLCLDLCTGTGALVPRLSPHYRGVVAVDISPEMLSRGRARFRHLPNLAWIESDAQDMPFADNSFDAISVSYGVRNLPDTERGLREMLRVCIPGGTLGILEFGQPANKLWSKIYSFYSDRVIPRLGGYISGDRGAYEYLPRTAAAFPCGDSFVELLTKTGWIPRKTIPLLGGIAYIYVASKPGDVPPLVPTE
jgi:demethylmenaquinone methyltransferase / 2-methoxy-6-polyprenyl-1,4-benzoquinol methylase